MVREHERLERSSSNEMPVFLYNPDDPASLQLGWLVYEFSRVRVLLRNMIGMISLFNRQGVTHSPELVLIVSVPSELDSEA